MTSMSDRLTDLDLSNNQLGPLTAKVCIKKEVISCGTRFQFEVIT